MELFHWCIQWVTFRPHDWMTTNSRDTSFLSHSQRIEVQEQDVVSAALSLEVIWETPGDRGNLDFQSHHSTLCLLFLPLVSLSLCLVFIKMLLLGNSIHQIAKDDLGSASLTSAKPFSCIRQCSRAEDSHSILYTQLQMPITYRAF